MAIKLLPPLLAQDATFVRRFRREADAAAQLNNPHIIPIHNYGEIDGRLYVDMRLIEGRDLEQVLADGPLEPGRAVRIIEQVAEALHAAHKVGLVHRDVKPSNVLLDENDFAYLIDFGIARDADQTALTGTGGVIGSWHYMSPERLRAGQVDARADIYALACVLYKCLTGSTPYPGDNFEQQITAHLTEPPPRPSSTDPNVPATFDQVIATGMAKNPDQRYATTVELANAAHYAISKPRGTRQFSQRWPNPEGTDYTPYREHIEQNETPRPKRKFATGQKALAVGAAAMLAAALVLALFLIFGRSPTEPIPKPSGGPNATPPQSVTLTTSRPAINSLPGTDRQGFVDYPGARCDPGNEPAVMARTTLSVLVVCQLSPGSYYYRAVRISDGASIELANAVRTSAGFDVTNPADGSLRQVRPTYVRIEFPGGPVQSEPTVGYASR